LALPKVYILANHRPALAETEGRGHARRRGDRI